MIDFAGAGWGGEGGWQTCEGFTPSPHHQTPCKPHSGPFRQLIAEHRAVLVRTAPTCTKRLVVLGHVPRRGRRAPNQPARVREVSGCR